NSVLQGANRTTTITLSAGVPTRRGYVSGLLSNDATSRTLSAGGAVNIGAGGGTLAASSGTVLTIDAPITVSPGGGRSLTVGTSLFVDNVNGARDGIVVLNSSANNWGSGADALAQLSIIGGTNFQNFPAGVSALPQGTGLAVNLGGVYQVNQLAPNTSATIQLGQITPQGGGILLNRVASSPNNLMVKLNAPISRSNTLGTGRGSVSFQTVSGQTLGTNDKVTFVNA